MQELSMYMPTTSLTSSTIDLSNVILVRFLFNNAHVEGFYNHKLLNLYIFVYLFLF